MIPETLAQRIEIWMYVIGAVTLALLGNYLAAVWASKDEKFTPMLFAVILVSPLVFITFGLVTARIGVAIGSGTIDALLTVSTIALGLFVFHEWSKLSFYQYAGIVCVIIGIALMQFSAKTNLPQ